MTVEGVLLAAGQSLRFGSKVPKQLLDFQGDLLVRRAARAALSSRLDRVVAVLGFQAAAVREALHGLPLDLVENPLFGEGQSSSVRAGLAALSSDCSAGLFIPIDQPYLDGTVIDQLILAHEESGAGIVIPTFAGRRGAPVLFARPLFSELERISGDEGGRQLVRRHPDLIREVELESELPLRDLDTQEDYRKLSACERRS